MNEKPGSLSKHLQVKRDEIGTRIKEIREKRGLSQEQLAELMGINRSTISKIETGKFAITIDYLFKFAWHLNFEVALIDKLSD